MARSRAQGLLERLRFPVRYPQAAVEIDPRSVAAVRVKREKAGPRLVGHGLVAVPPGVLLPTVASPKIVGRDDLRRALELAVERAGIKPGKISVLIPDSAARVWVLALPEIPRKAQAMAEVIRWKVKRSVPYRIEDGSIVWQVLARPSSSGMGLVLAGLLPKSVRHAYEELLAEIGLKAGLVDLPSFNLFNLSRRSIEANGKGPSADFAVLNATASYFTLLLFRQGVLAFYRCKSYAEREGSSAEGRLKHIRRELATSLSYYTEKLSGRGLGVTYFRSTDPDLREPGEALGAIGLGRIEPMGALGLAGLPQELDESTVSSLIPALGAATGRLV
jgi:type IV pilus assembly protein PilM